MSSSGTDQPAKKSTGGGKPQGNRLPKNGSVNTSPTMKEPAPAPVEQSTDSSASANSTPKEQKEPKEAKKPKNNMLTPRQLEE